MDPYEATFHRRFTVITDSVWKRWFLTALAALALAFAIFRNRIITTKYRYDVLAQMLTVAAVTVPRLIFVTWYANAVSLHHEVPTTVNICGAVSAFVDFTQTADILVLAAISLRRAYKIVLEITATKTMYKIFLAMSISPWVLFRLYEFFLGDLQHGRFCSPIRGSRVTFVLSTAWLLVIATATVICNLLVAVWQYVHGKRPNGRSRREEVEISIAFILFALPNVFIMTSYLLQHWQGELHWIVLTIAIFTLNLRTVLFVINAIITLFVISDFYRPYTDLARAGLQRFGICKGKGEGEAAPSGGLDNPAFEEEAKRTATEMEQQPRNQ